MREIKFRGKRIDNGNFEYGFYIVSSKEHHLGENHLIVSGDRCNAYAGRNFIDVDPKTVGQFTGLKDKNGKEIYEGDIIETDNSSYFKIIWDKDILGFRLTYDGLGDKGWFHVMEGHGGIHTWAVIGNIYENQELIK